MAPSETLSTGCIHTGDSMDVLDDLPANSVHAVVTDPPYGLAFMGRSWDDFEPKEYQEFCERWASKALRVLKPGGHLLAFSGNRTHHRLFSGVEDAGFEVRDTVTWHYGSGFPKALDVSKQLDKEKYKLENDMEAFGEYLKEHREDKGLPKAEIDRRLGTNTAYSWWEGRSDGIQLPDWDHYQELKEMLDLGDEFDGLMRKEAADRDVIERTEQAAMTGEVYGDTDMTGEYERTAPATDAAERWDGWKTTLKPATEFVVVARAPLSEGTVAENVQTHGTGALNIDGTRIGTDVDTSRYAIDHTTQHEGYQRPQEEQYTEDNPRQSESETGGRYPSNVVFDETAAAALDREVGKLTSGSRESGEYRGAGDTAYGEYDETDLPALESSAGGPSRYFYTSKATRAERTLDGTIDNAHPTVKPADLMEWLVRLVTAEGQVVVDPFAGSGTTCRAAKDLGREFVGIEKDPTWADVARVRCGLTPRDPSNVRGDDAQAGLEAFDPA